VVVQDMNFSPSATSGEEGIALFRSLRRIDPFLVFLGVALLWAAGLAATYFPARKGARVAPAVATRNV